MYEKYLKKQNGSGTYSLMVGIMIIMLVFLVLMIQLMYDSNIKLDYYTEDGLSASLLGAAVPNIEEYGLSNLIIINEDIINPIDPTGVWYNDLIAIPLDNGEYYIAYALDTSISIDGELANKFKSKINEDTSPIITETYKRFIDLLSNNLNLENIGGGVFKPKIGNSFIVSNVTLTDFKIYNYYEYVIIEVEDPEDTGSIDPEFPEEPGDILKRTYLIGASSDKHPSCDTNGDAIYASKKDLIDNKLIHTYIVEYTYDKDSENMIKTREIGEEDLPLILTNGANKEVYGTDGYTVTIDGTTLYARIAFKPNYNFIRKMQGWLSPEAINLANNPNDVVQEKIVKIDSTKNQ